MLSVLRQQTFDALNEKMEGIILIVRLRLGQKQKSLLPERLRKQLSVGHPQGRSGW
jgi:hypothetical protein